MSRTPVRQALFRLQQAEVAGIVGQDVDLGIERGELIDLLGALLQEQ